MTNAELVTVLEATGYTVEHGSYDEPVSPPFIAFLQVGSDNLSADNYTYKPIATYQVELYTDKKDPAAEAKVELQLKNNRLPFSKYETWIDSEKLYQIVYQIQIMM